MCMESWVIWGRKLKWGDSETCTRLFQFQSDQHVISPYFFEYFTKPEGVENKHNYDEWAGFVLINCQILKTDGKDNPQQLVKKITC